MKVIDQERVEALTLPRVVEHLSRVQAAMDQYGIHVAKLIFNFNETSVQFNKTSGCSIQKRITERGTVLYFRTTKMEGTLDRMTIMPVIAASDEVFKPVVVMPDKQSRFFHCKDDMTETIHSFPFTLLPPLQGSIWGRQPNILGVGQIVF